MPRIDEITPPKLKTLRRYGLTATEWLAIVERQGGSCPICQLSLAGRTCVTDHEHVRGWKKMRPEERKKHVRGILHSFCNSHCVGRFMTLAKAIALASYLKAHHDRRSK